MSAQNMHSNDPCCCEPERGRAKRQGIEVDEPILALSTVTVSSRQISHRLRALRSWLVTMDECPPRAWASLLRSRSLGLSALQLDLDQWFSDSSQHPRLGSMVPSSVTHHSIPDLDQWFQPVTLHNISNLNKWFSDFNYHSIPDLDQWFSDSSQHSRLKSMVQ